MLGKSSSQVKPIALGATVQSSTYGQTIPVIYGRTKSALYLIWEQNIRQGGGGKKYKKSLGKKSPPDYEANVDFLLGHNPMIGVLQAWQNQNLRFPLNFVSQTFGFNNSITIADPLFYLVLGVVMDYQVDRFSGGGDVTLPPDYGAPNVSTVYPGVTHFYIPAWNICTQGPDPGYPAMLSFFPWYRWVPGSGPTIYFDGYLKSFGGYTTFANIIIYYAQLDPGDSHDFTKHYTSDVPLTALRLTFENILGDGPEYGSAYAAQQIFYPHYAGVGSPNFDMGSTQTMPDTRLEVLGSYPLFKTGDADFVDIIADIFKQGIAQAGYGAALPFSPSQRGLNCFNYPACIQMMPQAGTEAFTAGSSTFPIPNTAGNYIIVALQDGGGGSGYTISDTDGNMYTAAYTTSGFALWYAKSVGAGLVNTVSVTGIGIVWNLTILEIAGVDTLDSVVTAASVNTESVTSTTLQGSAGFLLAMAQYDPDITVNDPGLSQWNALFAQVSNLPLVRTIYSPGTFTIPPIPQPGGSIPKRLTIFAFKSGQPVNYPKPLGDILDRSSLECTRAQDHAYGLFGSLVMDSQQKASEWLKDLYDAANAAPVWSGFKLKTIPYSEVSTLGIDPGSWYLAPSSYGGAFFGQIIPPGSPVTVPPLSLTESDFIGDANTPLITVERKAQVDVPNILQVQFPNRSSDYNSIIVSQPEDGTRALYGPRKDSPRTFNCVQDPSVARTLLGIMVRKQTYLRNTYKFKLNAKWKLLEPMDLILLPQSATMPTINGVPATQGVIPVRLTSISESEIYELDCEAEPYIWGTYAPTPLTVTAPQPYQPEVGVVPSSVNTPIIFEPVPRLSGEGNQNELWFVVSDHDLNYGGCLVLISVDDGNTYSMLGTITGNAITGYTTADWPSTVDPDTTADLFVDLTESNGALLSYSVKDEDKFVHPCYVGNNNGGAIIQLKDSSASGTSLATAFTTNNVLNNAIIVAACHDALTSIGTLSVTDSNGNSYSQIVASPILGLSDNMVIFAAFNIAAGANTVTLHTTVSELIGMRIYEVSGIASADASSAAATVGITSGLDTGTIVITSLNDFQMSFIWDTSGTTTFVANAGWSTDTTPSTPNIGRFNSFSWSSGGQTNNFLRPASVPVTTSGMHVAIVSFKAKLPDNFAVVPYELMTYAIALLGAPFNYQMFATGGGTNHLRRSVFGAPTVGVGPDHPKGSRFAFLQPNTTTGVPGILKQRMDPIWIGRTLHFKFQAFNQSLGGLQDLSAEDSQGRLVVADYIYTPRGTYGSVNPFSQDYVESPASPLTNPTSTTIHMVQVTFTFSGNTNPAIYNARTFTIPAPTVPTLYYVTITDPGFIGDNGALTTLPGVCQTSNALVGVPGNTYIGSIVALPAGGGGGNPGGLTGGQPPPTAGHYIPDPIIAGAITPDLGLGLSHEVTLISNTPITINNPVYNGGTVPVGTEFIIVIVQDVTGGRPTPTWAAGYTGVTGFLIGGDGLCRNTFRFIAVPGGTFARSTAPDVGIT